MRNETVILTGASGVIGQRFLRKLQSLDYFIYALYNTKLPPSNVDGGGIVVYKIGDLAEDGYVQSLPEADIIIHCASPSSPEEFQKDPIKTRELNTSVTEGLLGRLKEDGKFLFLSSSEVYSGVTDPPYNEFQIGGVDERHPRACYINGKIDGEIICRKSRKDFVIARLAHIYGEGANSGDGRMIYDFIKQALIYGGITIKGNVNYVRSYCYAADAVEMMWNVLLHGKYHTYNIGGERPITIREMGATIAKLTDAFCVSNDTIIKDGAPASGELDMTRYNSEFGKYNYTPLEEGLKKVIEYYRTL
jgi:UDP-glucuronate decarboxylase